KRCANRSRGSECVRFNLPLPAISTLRPTEPLASKSSTSTPAARAVSAPISPAGPPPMTARPGRGVDGMERLCLHHPPPAEDRVPYTPIVATLGYVLSPDGEHCLMVHRNARPGDNHLGKYNGLGGKIEPDEDVMAG